MRPYYQNQDIVIYHGDCRELLPQLGPVDLLVSDVAYQLIGGGPPGPSGPSGILKSNKKTLFTYNDIKPVEYASLFYNVLKEPAHCYVMINVLNLEQMLTAFRLAGFDLHNQLPWIKNNATPTRWYMKDVEYTLFFRKGAAFSINDCSERTSCLFPNPKGKIHETEKPLGLMQKFIRNSSQPGQVVLDPMMGSGTTLEAAQLLGRRAIGIDIDERKCETAARRLSTGVRVKDSRQLLLLEAA